MNHAPGDPEKLSLDGITSLDRKGVLHNYEQLLGVAEALDGPGTTQADGFYLQALGATAARFVEQIVWADQRVATSEVQAIDTLIARDNAQGGCLGECLRVPCVELTELSSLPELLRECARRDGLDGTGLGSTALDAFESLGLALMASDHDIAEEEVSLVHTILGAWRRNIVAPASA